MANCHCEERGGKAISQEQERAMFDLPRLVSLAAAFAALALGPVAEHFAMQAGQTH